MPTWHAGTSAVRVRPVVRVTRVAFHRRGERCGRSTLLPVSVQRSSTKRAEADRPSAVDDARRAFTDMSERELSKPRSQMRWFDPFKARSVWVPPVVLVTLLIVVMTLVYFRSVVNPTGHLHGLPVAVVNQDAGPTSLDSTSILASRSPRA